MAGIVAISSESSTHERACGMAMQLGRSISCRGPLQSWYGSCTVAAWFVACGAAAGIDGVDGNEALLVGDEVHGACGIEGHHVSQTEPILPISKRPSW